MLLFPAIRIRGSARPGRAGLWLLLALGLWQCSTGYQAPVSEQGVELVYRPPIIVSSGTSNASTPRGSISSVSRNAGNVSTVTPAGNVHKVRRGDTLFSIAFQYDLDFRSLALANNLSPPYTIFVDQNLNLDVSKPVAARPTTAPQVLAGTVVNNNSVASARAATTTPASVIRQSIGSVSSGEPDWKWPLSGRVLNGFQANSSASKGIDIAAVAGQPVLAAAEGDVVYAGNTIQGSGNLIIIRHNDRYLSAYAQNRSLLVAQGAHVRPGDTIAEAGQGADGIPRLHFEIRVDGKPVDPVRYLPRQ